MTIKRSVVFARLLANTTIKKLKTAITVTRLKSSVALSNRKLKTTITFARLKSSVASSKLSSKITFARLLSNITLSRLSSVVSVQRIQTAVVMARLKADALMGQFLLFLNPTDTANASENTLLSVGKNPSDSSVIIDNKVHSVGKNPSDSSIISESPVFAISAVRVDSGVVTESVSNDVSKSIADIPTVNDVFAKTITFNRSFSDNAFATDDVDGAASAEDDQEIQFFKVIANIGLAAEQDVKLFEKQISDIINVSDAGVFRGQGYCDFEYFADDYVGFSGSF